jgi:DNA-binding response OmpR family regulator
MASAEALTEIPTILVVEDDDAIQELVEDALSEGGFAVAIARTGEEAVTLLKGRLVTYGAVVIDIRLIGRFNGWEVARAAREVDPDFPVIYMSGSAGDQWPIQGVPKSIMLNKPFAPVQLVTALSQLLNERSSVASDHPSG